MKRRSHSFCAFASIFLLTVQYLQTISHLRTENRIDRFSLIQDHFSELNLIALRKGHHERHLYSFVMAISEAGTMKS